MPAALADGGVVVVVVGAGSAVVSTMAFVLADEMDGAEGRFFLTFVPSKVMLTVLEGGKVTQKGVIVIFKVYALMSRSVIFDRGGSLPGLDKRETTSRGRLRGG